MYIIKLRKVTKCLNKEDNMNNLKFTRKSRRLTQKELARLLHMSTSTYIKKERNLDYFRVYEAMEVSKILQSDINYLFKNM